MLEKWQCSQHRIRTVRRRIYAAHLTVYRGILEPLEQAEIDAFPNAFVTYPPNRAGLTLLLRPSRVIGTLLDFPSSIR
jgi:hypothetical protein